MGHYIGYTFDVVLIISNTQFAGWQWLWWGWGEEEAPSQASPPEASWRRRWV